MENITVAVIAGGMSRRFGADKTLAKLHGKPLIQWVAEGAQSVSGEVIVISKNSEKYAFLEGVSFAVDLYEQQCPLVGLLTALSRTRNNRVFMISADMPLFPFEAIAAMLMRGADADVIIPDINGKTYPCAALYCRKDYEVYESLYREGNFRMTDALKQVTTRHMPYEIFAPYDKYGCAFTNVNTPNDLAEIEREMCK